MSDSQIPKILLSNSDTSTRSTTHPFRAFLRIHRIFPIVFFSPTFAVVPTFCTRLLEIAWKKFPGNQSSSGQYLLRFIPANARNMPSRQAQIGFDFELINCKIVRIRREKSHSGLGVVSNYSSQFNYYKVRVSRFRRGEVRYLYSIAAIVFARYDFKIRIEINFTPRRAKSTRRASGFWSYHWKIFAGL